MTYNEFMTFRNRIVFMGEKPASEFTANPFNPRKHPMNQREAVNASLTELGWVDTVIENINTGNLIDGHERVWQAMKEGEDTPVPFILVDLTEEEEKLALAILDPLTNMATTDGEILKSLVEQINIENSVLNDLLGSLDTICDINASEPPNFAPKTIIIEVDSQREYEELCNSLGVSPETSRCKYSQTSLFKE